MAPPATISQIHERYTPVLANAAQGAFGKGASLAELPNQLDMWQTTLLAPVSLNGVGVHSGAEVCLTLRPAQANTGIVFVRTDVDNIEDATIPALTHNVCEVTLSSKIGNHAGHVVGTVEHLMAALAILRVDNVIVEIDGAEVPIMDGSAAPFVEAIERVGIKTLSATRRVIRILRPVRVDAGDSYCELLPDTQSVFEAVIDFESSVIGRQSYSITLDGDNFDEAVTNARTFCLLSHIEAMHSAGLALGGSVDNVVVVDDNKDKLVNEEGLRSENEFVQHKLLDAIGDLYLLGLPMIGRYRGYKSGHALHNKLLHKLFMEPDVLELVDLAHPQNIPPETSEKILAAE